MQKHYNEYFCNFLSYYNYPDEAVKVLTELARQLDSDTDFGKEFDIVCNDFNSEKISLDEALSRITKIGEKRNIDYRTSNFIFLMICSENTREKYKLANIPDEIFLDTFADLKYKLLECMECENTVGTFVPGWYGHFFKMKLFTYGRFEYVISQYDLDFDFDTSCGIHLTKGDLVLDVHIPSSGISLTDEVRFDSYKKAYKAFSGLFKDGRIILKCGSWLLYPNHRKFLPKNSNILRFMDDWEQVCFEEKDSFYYDWRIFGHYSDLPLEEMPADNSLRKAYKDWLMSGNKCGDAIGILVFDGEKIIR